MQSRLIVKHAEFEVHVLSDGTVRLSRGGSYLNFTPDIAPRMAKGLLAATVYIAEELSASLVDVPDYIQEAKKATKDLEKIKDRIDLIE